jgi:hypothetical protein
MRENTKIKFEFDDNLIGYIRKEEAACICDIIKNIEEASTILDTGCFLGKLTWSLCKTFPLKKITALDIWYNDLDPIGSFSNHSNFLKNNNEHKNLSSIKLDFLKYNNSHDIIILGSDNSSLNFKDHIDHAIILKPNLIIGRHAYNHKHHIRLLETLKIYKHTLVEETGIYTIDPMNPFHT